MINDHLNDTKKNEKNFKKALALDSVTQDATQKNDSVYFKQRTQLYIKRFFVGFKAIY